MGADTVVDDAGVATHTLHGAGNVGVSHGTLVPRFDAAVRRTVKAGVEGVPRITLVGCFKGTHTLHAKQGLGQCELVDEDDCGGEGKQD